MLRVRCDGVGMFRMSVHFATVSRERRYCSAFSLTRDLTCVVLQASTLKWHVGAGPAISIGGVRGLSVRVGIGF